MRIRQESSDRDGFASPESSDLKVLSSHEERSLLRQLAACKSKLAQSLANIESVPSPAAAEDPQILARCIAAAYANDGPTGARLGAIHRKYSELRGKLALANLRLVAHVAKRFRDRGVPYSDLLQEGFCGLIEAIDRFDLSHETKLATYATWWIRQSMQRAVAAGAYPVRLTPRHLRQLAQNQEEQERQEHLRSDRQRDEQLDPAMSQMIHRIHSATRPTISLDASLDRDSSFTLLQTMSDPDGDHTAEVDSDEAVQKLIRTLRPREQQVLSLRFGLGGRQQLSLSQVGKVLGVSKERVRQIQDRALKKLRFLADQENLQNRLASSR
jgi:RNA polymerase primary sigma factor